jgi:hypothetical protein
MTLNTSDWGLEKSYELMKEAVAKYQENKSN